MNDFNRLFVLIIFTLFLAGPVRAEEKLSVSYSEISSLVLQKNPAIRAARSEWRAAKERVPQARSWPDPILGFVTFSDELQTRAGPMESQISVSQRLPFYGKRKLKGTVEEQKAHLAEQMYRAKSLDVLSRTAKAYYELYYLDESIRVHEDLADQLRSFSRVAERKFSTGRQSQSSVYRAQVELARLLNDLITLQQKRQSTLVRLNALLDRSSEEPVNPQSPDFKNTEPKLKVQALKKLALESRPELLAVRALAAKAAIMQSLATRDFFPDVTVGYERSRIGSGTTAMSFDGKDAQSFMFKLNMPLWYNRLIPKSKEARARKEGAEAWVKDWENRTAADVEEAVLSLETAQRLVSLYNSTVIPQAQEALKSSQRGYESDHVSFLDLLDSVRSLLEFELNYYRSLANEAQARADLEKVVGVKLTGFSEQSSEKNRGAK